MLKPHGGTNKSTVHDGHHYPGSFFFHYQAMPSLPTRSYLRHASCPDATTAESRSLATSPSLLRTSPPPWQRGGRWASHDRLRLKFCPPRLCTHFYLLLGVRRFVPLLLSSQYAHMGTNKADVLRALQEITKALPPRTTLLGRMDLGRSTWRRVRVVLWLHVQTKGRYGTCPKGMLGSPGTSLASILIPFWPLTAVYSWWRGT